MEKDNYNDWHKAHVEENDTSTPWHNFVKKALCSTDLDNKIALEIGCGRGGFSDYLLREYGNIGKLFACDYSESALAIGIARSWPSSKVAWQKEDIQNLSFADNFFDTVISCETIEHVPRPQIALQEIYRVLKPGGRFILTCPNYFNLFGIWCLYRKIMGKPYTEGGQPYVNYILVPRIYGKLNALGFHIEHYHSSELVLPARRPKTFYPVRVPQWLRFFGNRTYYILTKT